MSKGGRRRATVWALLAVAAATGLAAAPATAAIYRVVECSPNYGIGAPDAEAFADQMGPVLASQCSPEQGWIGLSAAGQDPPIQVQGAKNGWLFRAPQGTQFVSAVALANGQNQAGVFPEIVSTNAANFQWANTGGAMPTSPAWLGWNGEGGAAPAIEARVRCVTSGGCPNPSGSAYITVKELGFTLEDSRAPAIGPIRGALIDPGRSVRGSVGVEIGGSDVGSGLYQAFVEAGGVRVADAGYGCDVTSDGQGRRLVPCPGSPSRTVQVNTADAPLYTGVNRLRLCVGDLAGQAACQEADARIDNACPDAGVPVAALADVRLKGGGVKKSNPATTRFGRKVKVRGHAVDGAGAPVAGATICLGHHLAGERYGPEEVNWTQTGPSGRFRFKLQRGPSNDFRVAAWQGAAAIEHHLTLLVKAKPKLKIKGKARPGKRLRLRVALNPPAIAGKDVRIQAKSNAGWVGVPRCSGETNAAGRFGCRAKVPRGTSGAKLVYRAVVPREAGYPYLRGHSRVKSKRIRG
jgi:hypothetical protein